MRGFCTCLHSILGSSSSRSFSLCSPMTVPVYAIRQVWVYFFFIALSDPLSANFIIFNEFLIAVCQFSRKVPLSPFCMGCCRGTDMEGTPDHSYSSKMKSPLVGLGHSPNFPHAGWVQDGFQVIYQIQETLINLNTGNFCFSIKYEWFHISFNRKYI